MRQAAIRYISGLWSRSAVSTVVELSGLSAIVYGVMLVSVPAGFVVGGLLAVLVGIALDRQ
jgi:hypothetical protein